MAQIQVLSKETIDKIAAGEVVERPSSVVKELLENAVDAKATAITVEIKEGGISLLRVTDNGCGIDKEQVPLAFLRHATSKIRTADDLCRIVSLFQYCRRIPHGTDNEDKRGFDRNPLSYRRRARSGDRRGGGAGRHHNYSPEPFF